MNINPKGILCNRPRHDNSILLRKSIFDAKFLINLLNFEILRKLLCLEMKTLNGKIHATNNYRGKILFNHQNEGKEKAIEGEREREGEIEIPRGGIDPVIIIYHSIFRRYK